jgi:hypothetical protein
MITFKEQAEGLDNHLTIGIPGMPLTTTFNYENNLIFMSVANPANISQFYAGLVRPLSQDNLGIGVFYSPPPFNDFIYLTTLANENPGSIVTTNWGFQEKLYNVPEVKLVFQINQLEAFRNLHQLTNTQKSQFEFAQKVAQNLYNFFESYPKRNIQDQNNQEVILLPGDAFQKWMSKFERKFKIDPMFVYKSTE